MSGNQRSPVAHREMEFAGREVNLPGVLHSFLTVIKGMPAERGVRPNPPEPPLRTGLRRRGVSCHVSRRKSAWILTSRVFSLSESTLSDITSQPLSPLNRAIAANTFGFKRIAFWGIAFFVLTRSKRSHH